MRILIVFIVIILASYFILRFVLAEPKNIPPDFLKARQQASLIAQDIVNLSSNTAGNLDQVSKLDQEQKYTEALLLVSQELELNREAREKAINLSNQLQAMAQNLAQISPSSLGQKALQAVSSETTLISRLINYNDYLNQLLEKLQQKLLGKSTGDGIGELVGKINDEAKAINDLNRQFNDAMKEFDTSLF